jgi:hypothetical protein
MELNPTQLEKPFTSKSEFYGQYNDRGERFLEKIKLNLEFELNDGSFIKIDPLLSQNAINFLENKEYKKLGNGQKLFFDVEGNSYSLSNFKKTKEFGSGNGFGGGSESTNIQESSQCVINEIAFKIKKSIIDENDLTDENIEKAYTYSYVTSPLNECKEFIKNKKDWKYTFTSTTNTLFTYFSGSNLSSHRESKLVKNIYNNFKKTKKLENIQLASDKWNPADIWLSDSTIKDITFNYNNINELNNKLINLFEEKKLIGVSLKKLHKNINLSINNNKKNISSNYKIINLISSPNSKDSKIEFENGKITFRTFNFSTNFAGEINGKTASHGKIGFGPLNDILKTNKTEILPNVQDIKQQINEIKFLKDFNDCYVNITENINYDDFLNKIKNKNIDWIISKYLSNKLLYIIKTQPVNIQNKILNEILLYSMSITDKSSIFIKIS